jgi:hypothetical protein
MKRFLLVILLILSVVIFSGCTGGAEKTSEKISTVDKADVSNTTQTEKNNQTSENKNTTVELENEDSTSNPGEESVSKTPLIEVALADGFSRYTDDIFGFSVDYPETWEQADVGGSLGGKAFNPPGEDSYKAVILVNVYANESEAKWWTADKETFEAMEKTGRILKFENVTINGREGTEVVYKSIFLPEDSDVAQVSVVFDVDGNYYVFGAAAYENYKSKYEKIFDTSLNSFVIDENLKAK